MKKILKELIENYPELEKSKHDLKKAIYYLKDNKVYFAASKEFKSDLKNRLNSISSIKSQKKSSFLIFMVPVFSFLFIVVGFTYYFKQINFLNDINNISDGLYESDISEVQRKNIVEEMSVQEKSDFEQEDSMSIKNLEMLDNEDIASSSKSSKIISEIDLSNKDKKVKIEEESPSVKNQEIMETEVYEKEDNSFENDDINYLLGAVGDMYPESGASFKNNESNFAGDARGGFESSDSMMMKTTSFYMIYDDEYMSFEDYCLSNSGSVLQNEKAKLCRVKQKYCLSSDYINGVCEFKEIK